MKENITLERRSSGLFANGKRVRCTECGSEKVWRFGYTPTKKGSRARAKCTECATSFFFTDFLHKNRE